MSSMNSLRHLLAATALSTSAFAAGECAEQAGVLRHKADSFTARVKAE